MVSRFPFAFSKLIRLISGDLHLAFESDTLPTESTDVVDFLEFTELTEWYEFCLELREFKSLLL